MSSLYEEHRYGTVRISRGQGRFYGSLGARPTRYLLDSGFCTWVHASRMGFDTGSGRLTGFQSNSKADKHTLTMLPRTGEVQQQVLFCNRRTLTLIQATMVLSSGMPLHCAVFTIHTTPDRLPSSTNCFDDDWSVFTEYVPTCRQKRAFGSSFGESVTGQPFVDCDCTASTLSSAATRDAFASVCVCVHSGARADHSPMKRQFPMTYICLHASVISIWKKKKQPELLEHQVPL